MAALGGSAAGFVWRVAHFSVKAAARFEAPLPNLNPDASHPLFSCRSPGVMAPWTHHTHPVNLAGCSGKSERRVRRVRRAAGGSSQLPKAPQQSALMERLLHRSALRSRARGAMSPEARKRLALAMNEEEMGRRQEAIGVTRSRLHHSLEIGLSVYEGFRLARKSLSSV